VFPAGVERDVTEKFLWLTAFAFVSQVIFEIVIIDVKALVVGAYAEILVIHKDAAFTSMPRYLHTKQVTRPVVFARVNILARFSHRLEPAKISGDRPEKPAIAVVVSRYEFAVIKARHSSLPPQEKLIFNRPPPIAAKSAGSVTEFNMEIFSQVSDIKCRAKKILKISGGNTQEKRVLQISTQRDTIHETTCNTR
jgi:hypothetical protein